MRVSGVVVAIVVVVGYGLPVSWMERLGVFVSRAGMLARCLGTRIIEAYMFQLMNSPGGATARIHVADFLKGLGVIRDARVDVVVKDRIDGWEEDGCC